MIRRRPTPVVSRKAATLFAAAMAACAAALVIPLFSFDGALQEGDVATRTIASPRDRQFESAVLTEAAREAAVNKVADVPLPVDTAVAEQQVEKLKTFVDQVRGIRNRTDLNTQQKLEQIGSLAVPVALTNAGRTALQIMDSGTFERFATCAQEALREVLSRPLQQADIQARIDEYLGTPANTPPTATELNALGAVLRAYVAPNFQVDTAATERRRDDARANVEPVRRNFSAGQVIVTEGKRLDAQDIEALKATGVIGDRFDIYAVGGGTLAALGFAVLLGVYAYLVQPFPAPPGRRMLLVAGSTALVLLGTRIALPLLTPDSMHHYYAFALPVAAAAMIAASFADLSFAAVVAVAVGLFAAFIGATGPELAGSSYVGSLQALELGVAYAAGGLAGAATIHRAERIGRYAMAAVAVALATGGVMVAFWLIGFPRDNIDLAWMALAATVHGAAAAVISVGVFVLLSLALGVTTRLQLLELGHAEHPLLRRLQDEAPGTYHHSMLVGALAERAAGRIGADALLVRVGAYYHDIGKLGKPRYFIENMLDEGASPHDSLEPAMSAGVIRDHVTSGIELARRYHLPPVVRDFIPQHHGTRLVTFFYRRAVQTGDAVDPAAFRYDGPRPQSKETAVVMLADSCEAIVRSHQDDSRPTIEELVDGVFAERLAEGQLDESDITMRELQEVAASFKATLRAVYHPRVPYPGPTAEEIAGLARGEPSVVSR
jgi:putative nucleotidyltransferase with HDIG domain